VVRKNQHFFNDAQPRLTAIHPLRCFDMPLSLTGGVESG
jgi:hypothetical protein